MTSQRFFRFLMGGVILSLFIIVSGSVHPGSASSAAGLYAEASQLLSKGKYQEAVDIYEQLIEMTEKENLPLMKISRRRSFFETKPACMAGVRISFPNLKAI